MIDRPGKVVQPRLRTMRLIVVLLVAAFASVCFGAILAEAESSVACAISVESDTAGASRETNPAPLPAPSDFTVPLRVSFVGPIDSPPSSSRVLASAGPRSPPVLF